MPEVKVVQSTSIEFDEANGVECEKCHESKDAAVSIETKMGNVSVTFILCEDCITDAVSTAVNDGDATTIESSES